MKFIYVYISILYAYITSVRCAGSSNSMYQAAFSLVSLNILPLLFSTSVHSYLLIILGCSQHKTFVVKRRGVHTQFMQLIALCGESPRFVMSGAFSS